MSGSSIISISIYFLLNLVVTITNKQLVSHASSPYLLTASHAFTTFIMTSLISRFRNDCSLSPTPLLQTNFSSHNKHNSNDIVEPGVDSSASGAHNLSSRAQLILLAFSLLYTLNIALSNLTLGLISLTLHQTIRATAPVLTVLLSVVLFQTPLTTYSRSVYLSIILTVVGVVLATNSSLRRIAGGSATQDDLEAETTLSGVLMTLLGALLAVLKTLLTNRLQRQNGNFALGIHATTLVRYLSPYAMVQALGFAFWMGELNVSRMASPRVVTVATIFKEGRMAWLWLWLFNAISASVLNVASFEANKRCGALGIAVAGNLKQVAILVVVGLDGERRGSRWAVILGSLMTVVGGIWYAVASAKIQERKMGRACG